MADFTIDVHGRQELRAALDDIVKRAQSAAVTIVNRAEAVVESNVKREFTGAHARGVRTGSAPGTPPEVVTGTLRRSVRSVPAALAEYGAYGSVYPTAVYARIQELGGVTGRGHHTHLPPRPYVRPGYEASKRQVLQIATEEWGKL